MSKHAGRVETRFRYWIWCLFNKGHTAKHAATPTTYQQVS